MSGRYHPDGAAITATVPDDMTVGGIFRPAIQNHQAAEAAAGQIMVPSGMISTMMTAGAVRFPHPVRRRLATKTAATLRCAVSQMMADDHVI